VKPGDSWSIRLDGLSSSHSSIRGETRGLCACPNAGRDPIEQATTTQTLVCECRRVMTETVERLYLVGGDG